MTNSTFNYILTGLSELTYYEFKIKARNKFGYSQAFATLNVTTNRLPFSIKGINGV